jgi:DNA-nicking Smr family endonuclease
MDDEPPPAPIPIDGVLDLHTFRPSEARELVNDYLDECRRAGVLEVSIIHGKGIGNLQRTVHSILGKRAESFASPSPRLPTAESERPLSNFVRNSACSP